MCRNCCSGQSSSAFKRSNLLVPKLQLCSGAYGQLVSGCIDSAVLLTFSPSLSLCVCVCVCVEGDWGCVFVYVLEWVKQAITIKAVWLGVFPRRRNFSQKLSDAQNSDDG